MDLYQSDRNALFAVSVLMSAFLILAVLMMAGYYLSKTDVSAEIRQCKAAGHIPLLDVATKSIVCVESYTTTE